MQSSEIDLFWMTELFAVRPKLFGCREDGGRSTNPKSHDGGAQARDTYIQSLNSGARFTVEIAK